MKTALFNLGFRPFFLVAGIYSIFTIFVWMLVYSAGFQLPISSIPAFQWHAHEMIYGYALAVVAGFLLTASRNWTGVQTLKGKKLMALVVLWLLARVLLFFDVILVAAIVDVAFNFGLALAIFFPVFKVRQWRQKGVLAILFLFSVLNLMFYLQALGFIDDGIRLSIYGGLYLLVILIFIMARRVVPMFTRNGVDTEVSMKNYKIVDKMFSPLLFVFTLVELADVASLEIVQAFLALALFVLTSVRLCGWFSKAIWGKALVWSLHLSMWSIALGFLLVFCSHSFGLSKYLAIHAFAYGGVGTITLAMMSRVAYGHTGRNLHQPPKYIFFGFVLMVIGTVVRVVLPIIMPLYFIRLIIISQALWVVAFTIFIVLYAPILIKPRVDGKEG